MAELRYNPLLNDWTMIASHRQNRPQMPKDWCPFCPGSGKVPESYEVFKYDNDFPALSQNPPMPDDVATDFFKVKPSYGKCEVVLYSPEHTTTLPKLDEEHIEKLVALWQERFSELSKDENIKYIFMFENKGEPVGVTMPHPHGQIYGYSVVPKRIAEELSNSKKHFEKTGKCLVCDILENEKKEDKRIITENEDFAVVLPFFSDYPYGIYIISKKHINNITQLSKSESKNLARILKDATATLDALFDTSFPYMMCMYQNPVNVEEDTSDYSHFHIKFYPPMRSADKQKFNASSETGAWANCNPTAPEEKAEELRRAFKKYKGIE